MSGDEPAVPEDEWAQTEVHKHSTYSCAKCGEQFDSPHQFYKHLDEVHPKEKKSNG